MFTNQPANDNPLTNSKNSTIQDQNNSYTQVAVEVQSFGTSNYYREELSDILIHKKVSSVYQPIVCLRTGQIMGYEALSRGPKDHPLAMPTPLFESALKNNMLFPLEQLCRETAIKNVQGIAPTQTLFLNINPEVVNDPHFKSGTTKQLIHQEGIFPKQVTFEITERTAITDFASFRRSLEHYREQGYSIAVDDAGAGYSSLQAIAELRPDYIKLDMSIIKDVDKNPLKQTMLEAMIKMASAINSKIIAEGIETQQELTTLIRMGVHYGQGYFLSRPGFPLPVIQENVFNTIIHTNNEFNTRKDLSKRNGLGVSVGEIVQDIPTVDQNMLVSQVEKIFTDTNADAVVVLQSEKPIGLLMKPKLYYHLGTNYGVSLYYGRPVERVMDKFPLIVNADLPLEAASQIAMSREEYNLYDYIIVVQDDKYSGVVSIMNLLNSITKLQINRAHNANPLTGLPGNLIIENKLKQLVALGEDFAVLYLDLDNFKVFNDKYGFEHGDKVLLYTAQTLSHCLATAGGNDFIGHVGGDDFIIITKPERAETIASLIVNKFDKAIPSFYPVEDLNNGFIEAKNRQNQLEKFPIIGISIAITSTENRCFSNYLEIGESMAEIKKLAKEKAGSCYVFDRRHRKA